MTRKALLSEYETSPSICWAVGCDRKHLSIFSASTCPRILIRERFDDILDGNTDVVAFFQSMHAVRPRDVTTLLVRDEGSSQIFCHLYRKQAVLSLARHYKDFLRVSKCLDRLSD